MNPVRRPASTALATADGQAYSSLRARSTPRAERYALGRGLRQQVPRSSLSEWSPSADRRDVLDLLEESHRGRISWLVQVRIGRMVASPYGFLRGAANVMAEDLARLPATGITPVICGDAHLGNFGFYASPERDLVLDLNDFDEAHPGPWEWDLRRLVTSMRELPPSRNNDYLAFRRAVLADVAQHLSIDSSAAGTPAAAANLKGDDLNDAAKAALDRGDFQSAIDLLKRLLDNDPGAKGAWTS